MDKAQTPRTFKKGERVVLIRAWTRDGAWYARSGTVISAGSKEIRVRCDATGEPLRETVYTQHGAQHFLYHEEGLDVAATALQRARDEKADRIRHWRKFAHLGAHQERILAEARAMNPRYAGTYADLRGRV